MPPDFITTSGRNYCYITKDLLLLEEGRPSSQPPESLSEKPPRGLSVFESFQREGALPCGRRPLLLLLLPALLVTLVAQAIPFGAAGYPHQPNQAGAHASMQVELLLHGGGPADPASPRADRLEGGVAVNRNSLKELKARNDIIAVARELGIEVPPGGVMRCIAPENHSSGDQVPSMRFDKKRQRVKCWGCLKIDFDVIGLVQHIKRCTFREAVALLQARAGSAESATIGRSYRSTSKVNQAVAVSALTQFGYQATLRLDRGGKQYLLGRGLSEQVIRDYRLGFVDNYNEVTAALTGNARDRTVQKAAGITSLYYYGAKGIAFVTIPYLTAGEIGRRSVLAVKARAITSPLPEGVQKYIITSGTVPSLYNAAILKTTDQVFICEGEIDCLTLVTYGYPAVGVPGWAAFKPDWAGQFGGKDVLLALDADQAGDKGARDIERLLRDHARRIRRVNLPRGSDINEFFGNGAK